MHASFEQRHRKTAQSWANQCSFLELRCNGRSLWKLFALQQICGVLSRSSILDVRNRGSSSSVKRHEVKRESTLPSLSTCAFWTFFIFFLNAEIHTPTHQLTYSSQHSTFDWRCPLDACRHRIEERRIVGRGEDSPTCKSLWYYSTMHMSRAVGWYYTSLSSSGLQNFEDGDTHQSTRLVFLFHTFAHSPPSLFLSLSLFCFLAYFTTRTLHTY